MDDNRTQHRGAMASRPNLVLAALLAAVGCFSLMQTLVIPAMSVLAQRLHTDTATAGWLITAFLLGGAVLTPVLSLLGDKYGHRRLLVIVLLVFLASTLGGAAAPNIGFLIAMRAVQGASMASLPLALAIVREAMPRERIASSFGTTAAMLGGGAGIGLVLGALIIQHTSWRWMFGVEAVFIALATLMVIAWVPESPERHSKRVDVPGAVLLAAGSSPCSRRSPKARSGAGSPPECCRSSRPPWRSSPYSVWCRPAGPTRSSTSGTSPICRCSSPTSRRC